MSKWDSELEVLSKARRREEKIVHLISAVHSATGGHDARSHAVTTTEMGTAVVVMVPTNVTVMSTKVAVVSVMSTNVTVVPAKVAVVSVMSTNVAVVMVTTMAPAAGVVVMMVAVTTVVSVMLAEQSTEELTKHSTGLGVAAAEVNVVSEVCDVS